MVGLGGTIYLDLVGASLKDHSIIFRIGHSQSFRLKPYGLTFLSNHSLKGVAI